MEETKKIDCLYHSIDHYIIMTIFILKCRIFLQYFTNPIQINIIILTGCLNWIHYLL
jgi:hypothetical protein